MTVQELVHLLETHPQSLTVKAVGHDHLCVELKKERISDNPTMPDEYETYLLVY